MKVCRGYLTSKTHFVEARAEKQKLAGKCAVSRLARDFKRSFRRICVPTVDAVNADEATHKAYRSHCFDPERRCNGKWWSNRLCGSPRSGAGTASTHEKKGGKLH